MSHASFELILAAYEVGQMLVLSKNLSGLAVLDGLEVVFGFVLTENHGPSVDVASLQGLKISAHCLVVVQGRVVKSSLLADSLIRVFDLSLLAVSCH